MGLSSRLNSVWNGVSGKNRMTFTTWSTHWRMFLCAVGRASAPPGSLAPKPLPKLGPGDAATITGAPVPRSGVAARQGPRHVMAERMLCFPSAQETSSSSCSAEHVMKSLPPLLFLFGEAGEISSEQDGAGTRRIGQDCSTSQTRDDTP